MLFSIVSCSSVFDSGKNGIGVERNNSTLVYFLDLVAALFRVLQYDMKLAFSGLFCLFLGESDLFFDAEMATLLVTLLE